MAYTWAVAAVGSYVRERAEVARAAARTLANVRTGAKNAALARIASLGGQLAPIASLPFGLSIMIVARRPAASTEDSDGGS